MSYPGANLHMSNLIQEALSFPSELQLLSELEKHLMMITQVSEHVTNAFRIIASR